MATSFTTARRFAGIAITLLFCLCLTGKAVGQGAAPLVTATAATGLNHPSGWGAIQQTAIDANGDWLVVDYANGAVYEFPAGGGDAITLSAPKGLGGGYQNPGIVIDPGNNLYLEANWNNCMVMFPWDPIAKAWTGLNTMTPDNPSTSICTNSGKNNGPNAWAQYGISGYPQGYFQPWALAIGVNDTLLVGAQNSGNFIFSFGLTGAWSNPVVSSALPEPINAMLKRPISIAQDPEGNIYFVEDSGGLSGLYEIPASTTGLTSDCPNGTTAPITSTCLTRVDPNLPAVTGVVLDSQGNLYISDSHIGVVMVPNTMGTPDTANAVVLTSVPAQGEVAFDWTRNTLYVPTSQKQANNQGDVAKVNFSYAELGASAVKTPSAAGANVVFTFHDTATVSRFIIVQDGATAPDFAITGGTCLTGTANAAQSSCLETVNFTPSAVGSISARLLMQKADPVAQSAPDANDVITAWCGSGGILTLTAENKLIQGELIQFTAKDTTDALNNLDQHQFNVLAAGLTPHQFAIKSSDVANCSTDPTVTAKTAATITAYTYTTLKSMMLHGVGIGPNIQATPAQESSIGADLVTPSQVAVDRQGDIYVADPGQGKVLMFAAGSGTSSTPLAAGKGLVAPTGIAIDGAGDIFIADNNNGVGSVYELPYMASGLNSEDAQVTAATGLGPNLKIALDNMGNLYVADPSNGRVVLLTNVGASGASLLGQGEAMLTAGFTAPSAVAVDHRGNLFVIDGANLFELSPGQANPVTLSNNLSGATGLAIDPSGAVYITSTSGTVRIPMAGSVLDTANQTSIASDVASSSAIALDLMGNVYVVQNAGGGVTVVGTNGTLTLPTPADLTSSTMAPAIVTNSGNAPLIVTGYTHTTENVSTVRVTDFTAEDGTCMNESTAPLTGIAAGGTCVVDVTLNPGPGAEGPLSAQIGVTSNAVNAPLTINANGMGLPLSTSGTKIAISGTPEVVNSPVTVTVAPKSTSDTIPTGEVAVTFQTWTVVIPKSGVPTINPVTTTVTADLDATGAASVQLSTLTTPVLAGNQAFTVEYIGDRTYGRSTTTSAVVVAKSAITAIALPLFPDASDIHLPFVPGGTGSGTVPYDGTENPWQYQFKMGVNTLMGIPTGTITMYDDSSACPPGTSTSGLGVAACALTGYKGVACPQSAASALLTVQNAGTLSGGQATFSTTCLWNVPSGTTYSPVIFTHYVHPEFSGDNNFLPYTGSATLFQAVRGPVVQITQTGNAASSTAAPTLAVQAGSSASIALTLTSILGYGFAGKNGQLNDSNFPVSLTCDIPLPHAQCAVTYDNSIVDPNQITAPNSVQIPCPSGANATQIADGSVSCTPGHAAVTVYTNVSAGTTTSQNVRMAAVTLAGIFGFGMIGLFFRRKSFEKSRMLLMIAMMVVGVGLAVSLTACSTTNLSPQTVLKTPAGTYQMTITAQEVGTQCVSDPGDPSSNCTTSAGGAGKYVYASSNQVSIPFYVTVTVQ